MTWVVCFQKFIVSYKAWSAELFLITIFCSVFAYLVLGMGLEEENIHDGKLVGIAVALELLSYPGSDGRYGHGHGVHRLHLRCL
jgi:hypothetical protein